MKTKTQNIARKLFFLISFLYFLSGNAQAPNKFSFQAVVRNTSNQLVTNQSVGVKISLISVVMSSETAEFEETHTVTTNANGLFSLKVGEGTLVSGDFSAAMSSAAQSKKIKCEIDPTGGTNYTIVSNEQLLSVPYALFANTAASTTTNNSWKITGNSNIDPSTQFIGTTDDNALQFKVNNEKAGVIETSDITFNTVKNGNTAFGYQSLNSNTTGYDNVANGYKSLFSNTTGVRNVANGYLSLYSNITGNYNVANGNQSLSSNTDGENNVANGSYSLLHNTSGSNNVANGANALSSNTIGYRNVANGYHSLSSNTTGNNNIANGGYSLYSNTTGTDNVANGDQSLYANTTGNNNVANGSKSLYSNTIGNNNVANGNWALYSNTIGEQNVASGLRALYANTTGSYNVANGVYSLYANISGYYNVANGNSSLYNNTTGLYNVANGASTLLNNTTGNFNTAIGNESGKNLPPNVNNVTCVGSETGWNTTSSNQINIGNFSVSSISGQVNWGTYSDKRIKTDVKENVPGLAFIKQLTPVTYHLDIKKQYELAMNGKKDESADYPEKYDIEKITQTGFLAQDVETASKNVGYNFSGVEVPKNGQGLYKLRYAEFVVPLVQAVKELSAENELLKQKNNDLESRLKALEEKISKL
jgi:hypothetical protein